MVTSWKQFVPYPIDSFVPKTFWVEVSTPFQINKSLPNWEMIPNLDVFVSTIWILFLNVLAYECNKFSPEFSCYVLTYGAFFATVPQSDTCKSLGMSCSLKIKDHPPLLMVFIVPSFTDSSLLMQGMVYQWKGTWDQLSL